MASTPVLIANRPTLKTRHFATVTDRPRPGTGLIDRCRMLLETSTLKDKELSSKLSTPPRPIK